MTQAYEMEKKGLIADLVFVFTETEFDREGGSGWSPLHSCEASAFAPSPFVDLRRPSFTASQKQRKALDTIGGGRGFRFSEVPKHLTVPWILQAGLAQLPSRAFLLATSMLCEVQNFPPQVPDRKRPAKRRGVPFKSCSIVRAHANLCMSTLAASIARCFHKTTVETLSPP